MKLHRLWVIVPSTLVLSCQWILGLEAPVIRERPPGQTTEAVDRCQHVLAPPMPAQDDDPTLANQKAYWLALQTISVLDAPGVARGLDLDESCTCGPDQYDGAPPCVTPHVDAGVCDEQGGVDNGMGKLFGQYAAQTPGFDLAKEINGEVAVGYHTLLLWIGGYNGLANDPDVFALVALASGLYTNLDCDGNPRPAAHPLASPDAGTPGPWYTPLWDGCDRWSTRTNTMLQKYPNRTPAVSHAAYVSGGKLVIPYSGDETVSIADFGGAGGALRLQSSILVVDLTQEGSGFRGDGYITGRVPFDNIVDILGRTRLDQSGNSTPTCQTPFWVAAPGLLCPARDTMTSPSQDRTNQTCDAVSGVLGFSLRPAQVDDLEYDPPESVSECPDAGFVCP